MLGKVIKYEFKSTARIFLLLYAALIVIAVINMFLLTWGAGGFLGTGSFGEIADTVYSLFTGIMMVVYICVAIAVVVVTLIIIIMRYYRMLGDEGYLWFTLPVTTNQHIFGRLIVAVVWSIASFVEIVLSILILLARLDLFEGAYKIYTTVVDSGFHLVPWIIGILLVLLVQAIAGILEFYAAISIGPRITKSRLGGSVLGYIIIYVGTQILSTIGLLVVTFVLERVSSGAFDMFMGNTMNTMESLGSLSGSSVFAAIDLIGIVIFGYVMVMNIIICAVCYYLSHRMVKKKLNLA